MSNNAFPYNNIEPIPHGVRIQYLENRVFELRDENRALNARLARLEAEITRLEGERVDAEQVTSVRDVLAEFNGVLRNFKQCECNKTNNSCDYRRFRHGRPRAYKSVEPALRAEPSQ